MSKRTQVLIMGWICQIALIVISILPFIKDHMAWYDWLFWWFVVQDFISVGFFMFTQRGRKYFIHRAECAGIEV